MKYDRVYWWIGGTERGRWNERAIQAGEHVNDLCVRIRNQGYVCVPGRASIGAPEGPPILEAFKLTGLNRYGAIDKVVQSMCAPCAAYHEARQGSGSCDRVSHSPDGPESNPVLAQEEEGPPEPVAIPVCMGCGCQMSEREYREQGACNDCRPDHEARQKESA